MVEIAAHPGRVGSKKAANTTWHLRVKATHWAYTLEHGQGGNICAVCGMVTISEWDASSVVTQYVTFLDLFIHILNARGTSFQNGFLD